MEHSEQAILQTLLYSDVFNFPLRKEELWQFLISKQSIQKEAFETALKEMSSRGSAICNDSGYYCLAGKEAIIEKRMQNLPYLKKKLLIARRAAYYLSFIPTIYFIGVSGGLAAENVEKSDDIDLFIITKKRTLFMTRLFVLGLMEVMHLRRKRDDADPADKVCLNLLIDEESLRWPQEKQDLYTAHEIVRLRPLFERHNTYRRFLEHNQWAADFFPNAFAVKPKLPGNLWQENYYSLKAISFLLTLPPIEAASRNLQKSLIRKHQTKEVITNSFLAFHPNDYRSRSLILLGIRLKQYRLLTKM